MHASNVKTALSLLANKDKAAFFPRFFKTGKGQYGEGDEFIGVTVPLQRSVAKEFRDLPLLEIKNLLDSPVHEHRLTGLLILVSQYEKTKDKKLVDFYLANTSRVNNWDLVDSTAPYILGDYLLDKKRDVLYRLMKSRDLWEQRIAIVATSALIKNKQFDDTLVISHYLLTHKHDLIHKSVGWMLREVGKQDEKTLLRFLDEHCTHMPRTALRYAIERLTPAQRKYYMLRN